MDVHVRHLLAGGGPVRDVDAHRLDREWARPQRPVEVDCHQPSSREDAAVQIWKELGVGAWHHEYMAGMDRPSIHERNNELVLVHKGRRGVAADDRAEDAVRRLRIERCHCSGIVPALPSDQALTGHARACEPLFHRRRYRQEDVRYSPYDLGVRRISIVGVPSSAGSYAAGQDMAPEALRSAGLIDALAAAGIDVHDDGDLPIQIWSPDREQPLAQNVGQVTSCLKDLVERLRQPLAQGDIALVLGGNCTIALGVMAALRRLGDGEPGLIYFDRHFDLNTPETSTDGALDWMGMAHALALPGCVDALVDALGRRPLLEPHQVAWMAVEPGVATEWERGQAARLGLRTTTAEAFVAAPVESVRAALRDLPAGPLAVHVDVDVLDFTDAPLAESTDGRNRGPTLDQIAEGLVLAAHDPRTRAVSIGEINPTRSAGTPTAIPRFVDALVRVVAATTH
jgi:arginase